MHKQIKQVMADPEYPLSYTKKTVKVLSFADSRDAITSASPGKETRWRNEHNLSKNDFSLSSSKLENKPVSATRDFPIGCGRKARKMTREEVFAARKEARIVITHKMNNHQKVQKQFENPVLKPSTPSKTDMIAKTRWIPYEINKDAKKRQTLQYPHKFENAPPSRGLDIVSKKIYGLEISARSKVRKALSLFQFLCRTLQQKEESVPGSRQRIDFEAATILRNKGMDVNRGKQIIGLVPGIEVGDQFHYRKELCLVGLHRQVQGGIDYTKQYGEPIATCVIQSGGYEDDEDNGDVLVYSGQGGNNFRGNKRQITDQKLKRGNLALVNSMLRKSPVRVIRGFKNYGNKHMEKNRGNSLYTYDGLYDVENYWEEIGLSGFRVYKYKLRRQVNQPILDLGIVTFSGKLKKQQPVFKGIQIADISYGRENKCIRAVNEVDDEYGPPQFIYKAKMSYPVEPLPHSGCSCRDGCYDRKACRCTQKNEGEFPYNHQGELVRIKPIVYECGPDCRCSSNCYNRVTQLGIQLNLEVFKTNKKGWGVRSREPIASGTFVCEYTGTILSDKQLDKCIGQDEYLFDIGLNSNTHTYWTDSLSKLVPGSKYAADVGVVEDAGFTIDALKCGNVGRFINHSCSPNLYAVNVLYDHDDTRLPHMMFFAVENIPPMRELSYSYNYSVDHVCDADGNTRQKKCHCGSSECREDKNGLR